MLLHFPLSNLSPLFFLFTLNINIIIIIIMEGTKAGVGTRASDGTG